MGMEELLRIGMPETETILGPEYFIHTSVGIIVHTQPFYPQRIEPDILIVSQKDQPREDGLLPWGLPAGRREGSESVVETAVRELFEETGIRTNPENFRYFSTVGRGKIVLSYQIHEGGIPNITLAKTVDPQLRVRIIPRLATTSSGENEIGAMALLPIEVFFDHGLIYAIRDHIPHVYRGEIWHTIRQQLLRRRVIFDY